MGKHVAEDELGIVRHGISTDATHPLATGGNDRVAEHPQHDLLEGLVIRALNHLVKDAATLNLDHLVVTEPWHAELPTILSIRAVIPHGTPLGTIIDERMVVPRSFWAGRSALVQTISVRYRVTHGSSSI